jgi:hypothetical protein
MKKIRITYDYNYLDGKIVQMWKIMGIPFTFEELPQAMQDMEEIRLDADTSPGYTMEDIYKYSDYLIAEECHPVLFDVHEWVENYEEIPD